jgi:hypothetical protein
LFGHRNIGIPNGRGGSHGINGDIEDANPASNDEKDRRAT